MGRTSDAIARGFNVKSGSTIELGKSTFPSLFTNGIRTVIELVVGQSDMQEGTNMRCSRLDGVTKAESRWKQLI